MEERPPIDLNITIEPQYYKKSGKDVMVGFDECFAKDNPSLNKFVIVKPAYSKNLDSTCRYANCFFRYYDTDKEFLSGLLFIKTQIDDATLTYHPSQFISDVAELLFPDTVIDKINQMVDDYYIIDLSPSDEVKDLDLHALQFLNEHGKSLMALSIAYRLLIPVVCHYYYVNQESMATNARKIGKPELTIKNFLYQVFASMFPLFQGTTELYNKLAVTVNSHLIQTKTSDRGLWTRAKNKAITPTVFTERLIESIITDLMPKAEFAGNIVTLIHVSIPFQIRSQLLMKDKCDYSDIGMSSKSDEPSALEKLEANRARSSDLDAVIPMICFDNEIPKIAKKYHVVFNEDEIQYYMENIQSCPFGSVVTMFFAKSFGGCYDFNSIPRREYIKLMIIFKHQLDKLGFIYLNQIFTGNISSSLRKRRISTKQVQKIQSSPRFKKLMKKYSMVMTADEDNPIIKNIAKAINTPMTYCDYYHQDKLGENIIADIDVVVDEYIRFLMNLISD